MAGGKNNSQKIEILESQVANISARLDVHDTLVSGINEVLKKSTSATEGHAAKIIVIEQQLLVLVDLKECKAALSTIREDLVAIRKDIESLGKWKDEVKKEKDEASRRRAAFGPNVTAALIGAVVSIIVLVINYFLIVQRNAIGLTPPAWFC